MSTYEAQSWQVPTRTTSWEQPPPSSKAGPFGHRQAEERKTDDVTLGMTSALKREEVPAFGLQIEGMLEPFIDIVKNQLARRLVCP